MNDRSDLGSAHRQHPSRAAKGRGGAESDPTEAAMDTNPLDVVDGLARPPFRTTHCIDAAVPEARHWLLSQRFVDPAVRSETALE